MAIQIPVYQQRVREGGLPGVGVRRGDPVGQAVTQLGQDITRAAAVGANIALDVQREQNNAAVNEAYASINSTKQKLLDDPGEGFTTTARGKIAGEALERYRQRFDDAAKEVTKGLNGAQQRAFAKILENERLGYVDALDKHVAREAESHAEQVFESAVMSSTSDAIGAAKRGDIDAAQNAIGAILGAVDQRAQVKGWDADVTATQQARLATQAHVGVLTAMVGSGDIAGASGYLKAARESGVIDEAIVERSGIEQKIERAGVRDFGRSMGQNLWQKSGGNLTKALEALDAEGIKDTERYAESRQWLKEYAADAERARRQVDSPILGRLTEKLFAGGGYTMNDPMVSDLSPEGRGEAAEMLARWKSARGESGAQARREQLERDRYAQALFDGLDVVGDQGQDKMTTDVDRLGKDLGASPQAIERIRARQKSTQTAVAKDKGVSAGEFRTMIDERLVQAGITATRKKDKIRRYVNGVYSRYLNEQKNAGIPPPAEVVDKWLSDWFTTVERNWASDVLGVQAQIEGAEDAPPSPFAAQEIVDAEAPLPLDPVVRREKVRMRRPDGSEFLLPREKVQQAIELGATVAE